MISSSPIPAPTAPDAEVDLRFLEMLADQSRRVSVAVFCLLVVMSVIAWPQLPPWVVAGWFAAAVAFMFARRYWLGALPRRSDLSLQLRVRIATVLSGANGTIHGLSLCAFPWLGEVERAFFTILLLGLCTGAVSTGTGRRHVFLAYALPTIGPLPLLWAWNPGGPVANANAMFLALLIALYFWLLLGMAANTWKTFEESVRIRFLERDLNLQLQQALTRANEASQAKTRFLAAASHDLRQPLHTIGLLVAALSLRPLNGRDREIIGLLSQVTVALSEQLDQLLDISRLDAGIVPVEHRLIRLDELVAQLFSELRAAVEVKDLQAIVHCEPLIHVHTDPALLLRILRNLTENAIKFTDRGFVSISVTHQDSVACISIEDSGCGIPPEEQENVFEEFYQVGNPERDRSRGLGLGLSIVNRLSDLLGIDVTMTSHPEVGTRFDLKLTVSAVEPAPPPEPGAAPEPGSMNLHVLVLDDERSVRQGVRLLLEELGCSCAEAATTQEALARAAERRPAVVLADMRLRGDDGGIPAVHALRRLLGPVPALLVSGDTAPDRLLEAAGAGIRLLHKPVSMTTLRSAILEATTPREAP